MAQELKALPEREEVINGLMLSLWQKRFLDSLFRLLGKGLITTVYRPPVTMNIGLHG